jgi:hypothetical protein
MGSHFFAQASLDLNPPILFSLPLLQIRCQAHAALQAFSFEMGSY